MENSISHRKHKLMMITLKLIPAIMALSYFMNVYCAFVGIGLQVITHYVGLVLAPMMYLYISSYVFQFCWYHRWFIHYMLIVEMINITDWYFHIPISNQAICMVHFGITAIFLIVAIITFIYKKYKNKTRPSES